MALPATPSAPTATPIKKEPGQEDSEKEPKPPSALLPTPPETATATPHPPALPEPETDTPPSSSSSSSDDAADYYRRREKLLLAAARADMERRAASLPNGSPVKPPTYFEYSWYNKDRPRAWIKDWCDSRIRKRTLRDDEMDNMPEAKRRRRVKEVRRQYGSEDEDDD